MARKCNVASILIQCSLFFPHLFMLASEDRQHKDIHDVNLLFPKNRIGFCTTFQSFQDDIQCSALSFGRPGGWFRVGLGFVQGLG
jgi:hypothetical protein